MNDQVEKLIVALMVLLEERGGECRIDADVFWSMYAQRHQKGIQVQEKGDEGIVLKMGSMPISPDDARWN